MFSLTQKSKLDSIDSRINNFPEWMPPMLVKELRQGLRTRSFVLGLIVSQLILYSCVLIGFNVGSRSAGGEMLSGFLIGISFVMAAIIQPLRGINGIAGDMKSKTLELMEMTRMNALGIITGKWVSLFSQTLLFFVTLLPYLIFRYLLGGMDLIVEFGLIALALLSSAVFIGLALCISCTRSVILRSIFIVSSAIIGAAALDIYDLLDPMADLFDGRHRFHPVVFIFLSATSLSFLTYLILECGAMFFAPPAIQKDERIRLNCIYYAAGMGLICLITATPFFEVFVASTLFFAGIRLCGGHHLHNPKVAVDLQQIRFAQGPLRVILSAGWPAGYLSFLVLSLISVTAATFSNGLDLDDESLCYTLVSAISFSVIAAELLKHKIPHRPTCFLITLAVQSTTCLMALFIEGATRSNEAAEVLTIIPLAQIVTFKASYQADEVAMLCNPAYIVIAILISWKTLSRQAPAPSFAKA